MIMREDSNKLYPSMVTCRQMILTSQHFNVETTLCQRSDFENEKKIQCRIFNIAQRLYNVDETTLKQRFNNADTTLS